jgi:starvation-inducible DNA-binding protein
MNTKNKVGLESKAVQPVIEKLGELLADYQVFYTNLRGFHWNIQGDKFFELHQLYEDYYNGMAENIDAVAERIVMLGGIPANSFSDYLKISEVGEISGVSSWKAGLDNILATIEMLVKKLRGLQKVAFEAGDSATAALALHGLKDFEKKIWMLSAYLKA